MNYERSRLNPLIIKDIIYLFSGSERNVYALNTMALSFETVEFENAEECSCKAIACLIENRVYLIATTYIQIYDTSLN